MKWITHSVCVLLLGFQILTGQLEKRQGTGPYPRWQDAGFKFFLGTLRRKRESHLWQSTHLAQPPTPPNTILSTSWTKEINWSPPPIRASSRLFFPSLFSCILVSWPPRRHTLTRVTHFYLPNITSPLLSNLFAPGKLIRTSQRNFLSGPGKGTMRGGGCKGSAMDEKTTNHKEEYGQKLSHPLYLTAELVKILPQGWSWLYRCV